MPKPTIILLHGALGSSASFDGILPLLSNNFNACSFDFSGHGKDTFRGDLSMSQFGDDILRFMDRHSIEKCGIFGYSMGGYAALQLAGRDPGRILSILTLGTKWEWNPTQAAREIAMLNAHALMEKVPKFALALEQTHIGQGWKALLARTAELLTELGAEGGFSAGRAAQVNIPVRILLGAEDKMVSREESERMAAALPDGSFRLLPAVPHPIDKVDPTLIGEEILQYFK